MMFGVKTMPDGDYCVCCNAKLIQAYDFCPKCGSPISHEAMQLRQQQQKALKIELLDSLASEIKDEQSLKVILNKLKNI